MTLTRRVQFSILLGLLALVGLAGNAVGYGIGFQARFDDPPRVVSAFEPLAQDFSVANPPKSIPPITQILSFTPKVTASSFDKNSLRFGTDYGAGQSLQSLIPMAVDALQYNTYRRERIATQGFATLSVKSLTAGQKQGGQGGVSVGVALPKQLDRVFGEGGGNLRVSGYRRISFSGRSQWVDGVASDLTKQSRFPSLNMDQVYRFDIEGTIGTKISVKVSEDSQTDIPLSNRIQLRYKGDEDDVLKSIEAGNTTLSLPGASFVGYSSTIQGLFGLRAQAQVGHLSLTAIASQEKGSSERSTVSATGTESATYVRDYSYQQNRIFDLSLPTDKRPLHAKDSITNVLVYRQYEGSTSTNKYSYANFYIDPDRADERNTNDAIGVKYEQVDNSTYFFYNDMTNGQHYIVFNYPVNEALLGVWLVVDRYDTLSGTRTKVDTIGDIVSHTDTLYLKMLRPQINLYNPNHPTWPLMWRNVYSVSAGASAEDLNIKIYKGSVGTEEANYNLDYQKENEVSTGTYLEILGLDQYNKQGQKLSDGLLDERKEVFRSDWGLIIFPSRRPFDSDTTFENANGVKTTALAEQVSDIYDYTSESERSTSSMYYIAMSSKTRSNIINLNRVNIIEGSERVMVNGVQKARGTDYTINYSYGQITLMSSEATDPNASVSIDFEYAPFLAIQKKSLIGTRAEYEFSKDLKLGTTWLYKSDKAQDRKPRVGQETARMTVFDVDGSWRLYPKFITKLVDALPFVTAKGISTLTLSGELAQSRPNPNIDNIAYIDDFESSAEELNLGTLRGTWSLSSPPEQLPQGAVRGKTLWHNKPQIPITEVYDKETKTGEGALTPFRMVFRPHYIDSLWDSASTSWLVDTVRVPSWGGIITYFGGVDKARVQLFEMRAKATHGVLHFDFGRISEDINNDGLSEKEAENREAMTPDLDIGLDGKEDSNEPGHDDRYNPDPDRDNWYSKDTGKCPLPNNACKDDTLAVRFNDPEDPLYYEYLNGTEGNYQDLQHLGLPDMEQLTNSGQAKANSYFSYKINFAADPFSDSSFYVQGSERNGWRTYRIPIRDSLSLDTSISTDGAPDWSNITHVRVWFEADSTQTQPDTVEIAGWYFVQSNWRDSLIIRRNNADSTKFVVATISTEDHTFEPPPGVEAYKDQSTGVTEPQRGLSLAYKEVMRGDTCLAIKRLASVDRYSGYRRLRMYVHGDPTAVNSDSVLFFFRMGKNDSTFYEYRTYLQPGWDSRNEVNIDFNALTALKDAAQRSLTKKTSARVDTTDGNYRVLGDPNINEIQYFAAGLVNRDTTTGHTATGTIWLDELRVADVRRDVGTAARVSAQGVFADFGNLTFNWQTQNPYFRNISATTRGGSQDNLGSGSTSKQYNWNLSLNMQKFLPPSWAASIPIGFSYSKSVQIPVLRTASDIVLPESVRESEKTQSVTRTFRISESFDRKGFNPLFSILLNRQKVSFSYSRTQSTTATRPYSFGETVDVGTTFNMGLTKVPTILPFKWTSWIPLVKRTKGTKLSLYPSRWDWSVSFNRSVSISDDVNYKRTSSFSRSLDGRMGISYKVFENLSWQIDFTSKRDLSDPKQVDLRLSNFHPGQETSYGQQFSGTYNPKLFSWIGTGLSYSSNYSDTYDRSSKTRSSTLSRNWGVSGDFKHLVLFSPGSRQKGGSSGRPDQGQVSATRKSAPKQPEDKKKSGAPKKPLLKKPGSGKPFYDPPFALLRFLTGWLDPIAYHYSKTYNNSLPSMLSRPSMKYRLGFIDNAGVLLASDSRSQTASESENYDFGSRFRLLSGIQVNVKYRNGITRDLVRQGSSSKRISTSWPDLDITIGKFQTLPLIKGVVNKFIDVFRPRTGYSRETRKNVDQLKGFVTDKVINSEYNPLLLVEFRVFKSLSMSATYTMQKSTTQKFNQVNGLILTDTRAQQKSMTVTARYSFRSPRGIRIPIFGKLRVTSLLTMDVNVRKTKNSSKTSRSGGPFNTDEDKSDFSVSPTIAYEFSQQIKGGLTASWQDINDNNQKKSHVRMLQMWAELHF